MALKLLCLDAGSSSLKFAVYRADATTGEPECVAGGEMASQGDADASLAAMLAQPAANVDPAITAIGHRVVFGGPQYVGPTRVADDVLLALETLVEIEPLHLRVELDLVYAARRRFPDAIQVLCFDTTFHRRMPEIAKRLPLPRALDPLLERYGFHGLSYEYVASQLASDAGRTVIAHLGSGASLCALEHGSPIDTTMGFSALGGLMMGTRPGDLDPGVVLRLLADGYDRAQLHELLYHRSGLLGVSGTTADMKDLIARSPSDASAREAVDLFVYQLTKHLGSMIAALHGLQTLVFTGGIGERAPSIRAATAGALGYLGARLDHAANANNARIISLPESAVTMLVVPTNENLTIARHTLAALC